MRDYHITYAILLLAIALIIVTMLVAPGLLGDRPPQAAMIASGAHFTLALASAAALCMTLWLVAMGALLRRWLPWSMTSPRVVALLALSTCVIFLATGAQMLMQRIIAVPPSLTLLLNVLRLTPVLLLLTYLIPSGTQRQHM